MVRNEQIASLERIRATRDDAAVTAALNALMMPHSITKTCWLPLLMPLAFAPPWVKFPMRWKPLSTVIWCQASVLRVIAQSYHQSEKSASEFDAIVANGAVPCRQWSSPAHSDR